jgi:activator of 2-hydroxyglutaryl-CoA dehydratase
MNDDEFEVVLTGGVLHRQGLVWQTVVAALRTIAPRAKPIKPRHDAAVGAALLAQQGGA